MTFKQLVTLSLLAVAGYSAFFVFATENAMIFGGAFNLISG